jgi:hypothetical protein
MRLCQGALFAFEPWVVTVDVEPEAESNQHELDHAKALLTKYQHEYGINEVEQELGGSGKKGEWSDEQYESVPRALKPLWRFQKRLRRSPEQCVRYVHTKHY